MAAVTERELVLVFDAAERLTETTFDKLGSVPLDCVPDQVEATTLEVLEAEAIVSEQPSKDETVTWLTQSA